MANSIIKDNMRVSTNTGHGFGTFSGVFTPSILTILGVIMFMRAGFVIGEAGLLMSVVILAIAKSITVLTTLSVGAICTNMKVRGGGAYFLISRVLGPEFGGSIGIALFFAQALSVPFYILGFTEALVRSYPGLTDHFLLITLITALTLFIVSWIGASWAIRTQFVIMVILAVSIVVFMVGSANLFSLANLTENMKPGYTPQSSGVPFSFWIIFAIYFPAVTGILAGINMSGDLKDPARSIPAGTLYAIGAGFLVYLVQMILMGGAFSRADLIARPFELLCENAWFGLSGVVIAGVFAATLSSALGSYLGAPRILQAMSRDRLMPMLKPFAKGVGKSDEPRPALILTGLLTVIVLLWAGNSEGGSALNLVAGIISMFFLYTYGMINLAAFLEATSDNPSFRPTFRAFSWKSALLGLLGCAGAALLVDVKVAIFAVFPVWFLYRYLQKRQLEVAYADARRGFVFSRVRENLFRLATMKSDSKNWRPTILLFSGNPTTRETLINYAIWLEANCGIVLLANIIIGDPVQSASLRVAAVKQLENFCQEREIKAFPSVLFCENFDAGVESMMQIAGLGPIEPNLVMFGWGPNPGPFIHSLRLVYSLGKSLILYQDGASSDREHPRIDVWWRGQKNGSLLVILAHLLLLNREWAEGTVRVLRVVENEKGQASAVEALQLLVDEARVEARAEAIVSTRPFIEVFKETSRDATCIFMGFEVPQIEWEEKWHESITEMTADMPPTLLVCSAGVEDMLA